MKRYRSIVLIVISTLALSLFISASLRVSDRAQASPMWLEPAVPVTSRRALDVTEGISVTALTLPVLSIVEELSTSFTYQGQLENNGQPVNADCSLAFRLYDAARRLRRQQLSTRKISPGSNAWRV